MSEQKKWLWTSEASEVPMNQQTFDIMVIENSKKYYIGLRKNTTVRIFRQSKIATGNIYIYTYLFLFNK